MLKLNPGHSGVVEGTMHKCLVAERSSHLKVDTEYIGYIELNLGHINV